MANRVGIVAILHESNTFISTPTTFGDFQRDLLLEGETIANTLATTSHEIGGFFSGLADEGIEAVPVLAARALPSGPISASTARDLVNRMTAAVRAIGPLDGWLVAPHGAAVAEHEPDFDGHWLSVLRNMVGSRTPIVGTLDLHANLSPRMVKACDALIAYRTNPHLDQQDRGREAARLLARTLRGEVQPTMAAVFPSLIANIERQATAEPHWLPLLKMQQEQREQPGVLSNSLLYGFPYADVPEMGSSVIVVTDADALRAERMALELGESWWNQRANFAGEFISPEEAFEQTEHEVGPICLLDMGDNVGGGSPADGTVLAHEFRSRGIGPALVVLRDPEAVKQCEIVKVGERIRLAMGGKTDDLHGSPVVTDVTVLRHVDGQFEETETRHGGIRKFDQGPTVVVETDERLTVILTTNRMAPFSLQQILSCGVQPENFRYLVAKGVHAPTAAYGPVCRKLIRVNTPGVTAADLKQFTFTRRRRPLYPFEL